MRQSPLARTERHQRFAILPPPRFAVLLTFLLQSIFLPAQVPPCTPPPGCGTNPQYFCGEVTDFTWAMMPDGAGGYNIFFRSPAGAGVPVTFFLINASTNTVAATQNVANGVFQNMPPEFYRLVICAGNNPATYCCKDLPREFGDLGCCELKYPFFTDLANPVWQFGDNTASNQQNPVHEYTNINTYPVEGTPQATVTLIAGAVTIQNTVQFPAGIWVGSDCVNSGDASAIVNSVNPALPVFPALAYQDRSISVKGSLTMNQNYQFTNCDFCMHPSARIVSTATTLSFLNNTTLHKADCKDRAWYGLEVQKGTIIGTNAIFTGAYNAVRVPSDAKAAPTFRFNGCTFERNWLGFNIAAPTLFASFGGNTFGNAASVLSWPELQAGFCAWTTFVNKPVNPRPFAGIYAETPPGLPVVTINLPPGSATNVFVNLANGIYLQDANAIVRYCRFQNMLAGAYPNDDGFGVALFTNNFRSLLQFGLGKNSATLTFDNCQHAMFVKMSQQSGNVLFRSINNRMNVGSAYTLLGENAATFRPSSLIQNNDISYANAHGVLVMTASPATRLTITRNRIINPNTNGAGISLLNSDPGTVVGTHRVSIVNNVAETATNPDGMYSGGVGVAITAFPNVLVENNTISGFAQYGVHNWFSSTNDIRCNIVSSSLGMNAIQNFGSPSTTIEHNQTDASDNGLAIITSSNNSTISCNRIGSHGVGLYYDASAVTGVQLTNLTSAGNTWIGTYTNWAAQNLNGNVAASRYFYRTGEINPTQVSPNALPPNDWFRQVTAGVTCGTGCPQIGLTGRTVTELDIQIADGSLAPGGLSGYLLKRFLYNDLLYYPALLQGNTTLQNFQTSFGAENGGKLTSAEKTMADAFYLTSQQQSQWDAAQSAIASAFDQLAILDSLAQNGAAPETQQAQRDALMQQILTHQATLQNIYATNLNVRIAGVSAVQQTLNSVSPQALWESNEKTLNEFFLNTSFVDQSPNATQTAQIRQIGEQCSMDGGPAVVRARAWYYSLTGVRLEVNCGGVIERGTEDEQKDSQVQLLVSPNPAGDKALIQFSGVAPQKGQLEIFEVSGRLRKTLNMPGNAISIEVSTAEFANGVYFCRLTLDGRLVATVKFSIQH